MKSIQFTKYLLLLTLLSSAIPAYSQSGSDKTAEFNTAIEKELAELRNEHPEWAESRKALPENQWVVDFLESRALEARLQVKMANSLGYKALLLGIGIQCLCRPTTIGGYAKTIAIGTAAQAALIVGLLKLAKRNRTAWYPLAKSYVQGVSPGSIAASKFPVLKRTKNGKINKAILTLLSLYPTLLVAAGGLCTTLAIAGGKSLYRSF